MAGAQFTIPLITVIPGQLIASSLRNNEFTNIANNLNPLGLDGYEDTDTQMQIQTAPYPGSVTSHASSLGGEIERIRYQISQILGATTPAYWYAAPPTNLTALQNITVPLGGAIDYHSATPPNANWLLADGSAIGRSAYAALNTLYSAASYPFGSGDGSTTFNLPNYQDRISIGVNSIAASAGATGGAQNQTVDTGHIHADGAHTHTMASHTHLLDGGASANNTQVSGASELIGLVGSSSAADHNLARFTTGGSTTTFQVKGGTQGPSSNTTDSQSASNTGSGTVSNPTISVLPPYLGMYRIIRVL